MSDKSIADRIEALEEPCREMDAEIYDTLRRRGVDIGLKNYTASLDAAVTLVPEGMGVELMSYWITAVEGPVWMARLHAGGTPDDPAREYSFWDAATPALALCAAALRAQEAHNG